MLHFYTYQNCDTCRKAKQWLDEHAIEYEPIDITRNPPPAELLRRVLLRGEYPLQDLFNTSGKAYRDMNLKGRLPTLDDEEAIELLSQNGRLCKRPIVTDGQQDTVGFDETRFTEAWGHLGTV